MKLGEKSQKSPGKELIQKEESEKMAQTTPVEGRIDLFKETAFLTPNTPDLSVQNTPSHKKSDQNGNEDISYIRYESEFFQDLMTGNSNDIAKLLIASACVLIGKNIVLGENRNQSEILTNAPKEERD